MLFTSGGRGHARTRHLIVDNYATHKHPVVQRWLKRHPRFHNPLDADQRFVAEYGRAFLS
jgi:hypothetical protein